MPNAPLVTQQLTEAQFLAALPKQCRKSVTQEVMDNINSLLSDPFMAEAYKDNILSYTSVMQEGKFKIDGYISAVKYISFKLLGSTNISAYCKAFPDKYQQFLDNGVNDKDIASYVSAYNKSKLVNLIFEQTLVPTHVLNADLFQKALNVQAALMMDDDVSPKVRSDAANSLLTHLKRPEVTKFEIDVSHKESSAISDLRETTAALARQQQLSIQNGTSTALQMAHSQILTGEFEEVI